MNATDFKFYQELLDSGSVPAARIPKNVKASREFSGLLNAGVIIKTKAGRGSTWQLNKPDLFKTFLASAFPEKPTNDISKASNIKSFRNSKARKVLTEGIIFLRGFDKIKLNDVEFDIEFYTKHYGLFAAKNVKIEAKSICFVENLETFLCAEHLLGNGCLYVHTYGRIGAKVLERIQCQNVLVFVDYDYNGLDEYLRIKKAFPDCQLMIPNDFERLFDTYSREMVGSQTQSSAVRECILKEVVMIRELVARKNRFLEQEVLIPDSHA